MIRLRQKLVTPALRRIGETMAFVFGMLFLGLMTTALAFGVVLLVRRELSLILTVCVAILFVSTANMAHTMGSYAETVALARADYKNFLAESKKSEPASSESALFDAVMYVGTQQPFESLFSDWDGTKESGHTVFTSNQPHVVSVSPEGNHSYYQGFYGAGPRQPGLVKALNVGAATICGYGRCVSVMVTRPSTTSPH